MWLDEKQIICMITSPQKPVPRKGLLEKKKKSNKQWTIQFSNQPGTNSSLTFAHFFSLPIATRWKRKGSLKQLFQICIVQTYSPRWDQKHELTWYFLLKVAGKQNEKIPDQVTQLKKGNYGLFKWHSATACFVPQFGCYREENKKSTTTWTPKRANTIIHALLKLRTLESDDRKHSANASVWLG